MGFFGICVVLFLSYITGFNGNGIEVTTDEQFKYAKLNEQVKLEFILKFNNTTSSLKYIKLYIDKQYSGHFNEIVSLLFDNNGKQTSNIVESYKNRTFSVEYKFSRLFVTLGGVQRDELNATFKCKAALIGDPFDDNAEVTVIEAQAPKVINNTYFRPGKMYLPRGSTRTIYCNATGTPSPVLFWLYHGKEKFRGTNPLKMKFEDVSTDNTGGVHTCKASSVGGVDSISLNVYVAYLERASLEENKVDDMGRLPLTCPFVGVPSPTFRWQRNNTKISVSRKILVHVAANYTCTAYNSETKEKLSYTFPVTQDKLPTKSVTADAINSGEASSCTTFVWLIWLCLHCILFAL